MPTVNKPTSGKRVSRQQKVSQVGESRHQLCPRVTVGSLPDNVLLDIFDFYLVLEKLYSDDFRSYDDAWEMLVHVCKRWRCIVFALPRRLQLRLLCTNKRPMQNALDVWPALPIVIEGRRGLSKPQDANNVLAVLKQHNRVCRIDIENVPNTFLKRMRAMKVTRSDPYPSLTFLRLHHNWKTIINVPPLPDSFLGGSAPQLQKLLLVGITFPALPKLLLSTRDLVELNLRFIPNSGYISPETIVTCLSALPKLQMLCFGFQSPRSRAHRENRLLPRLMRTDLPSLIELYFKGDSEYLEDIVGQVDTPRLHRLHLTFFNQLTFNIPLLHHFISRTSTFDVPYQARIIFYHDDALVWWSFQRDGRDHDDSLTLTILSRPTDWQLSSLAQFCDLPLSPLPTLERLEIDSQRVHWEEDMESTQWLGFLHLFASVKELTLCGNLIELIARALEDLVGERVAELLPALQYLSLQGPHLSEPIIKAIVKFIAVRQLSGCPVAVRHRESEDSDWRVLWEVGD